VERVKFVGVATLAQYWWCDLKSVFLARELSEGNGWTYDTDILRYGKLLGHYPEDSQGVFNKEDRELMLSKEKSQGWQDALKKVANIKLEGDKDVSTLNHWFRAEKHPTIRWEFKLGDYRVIALPDGVGVDFIYGFKVSDSGFLRYVRGPAIAQASLYTMLFEREKIRLQFYLKDEDRVETVEQPYDKAEVDNTLKYFTDLEMGLKRPFRTKALWKCRNCEYVVPCERYGVKI
jgi:CRISPR/Cas system-associated exonuclease Cas4 (RecB family)